MPTEFKPLQTLPGTFPRTDWLRIVPMPPNLSFSHKEYHVAHLKYLNIFILSKNEIYMQPMPKGNQWNIKFEDSFFWLLFNRGKKTLEVITGSKDSANYIQN